MQNIEIKKLFQEWAEHLREYEGGRGDANVSAAVYQALDALRVATQGDMTSGGRLILLEAVRVLDELHDRREQEDDLGGKAAEVLERSAAKL